MGIISLQFSARDSLSSKLIRAFEHGQWSHVDYVMPDGRLLGARSSAIGDIPAGVQIRPPDYLPFSRKEIVNCERSDEISNGYYEFLRAQLGKPYDSIAIAAFVFGRNWRDDDAWFCDELQAGAAEASKLLDHPLAVPNNRLTPDGLYLVFSVLTTVKGY